MAYTIFWNVLIVIMVHIHFSDYVFPNIWEVARRIVDDLRSFHPAYVFRIAPDTIRDVIIIEAVHLSDVKELHQTKFIPRNCKVEFITYMKNGDTNPIYRTVGTYNVTDPDPDRHAYRLTYTIDKLGDKYETCVRKKDFNLYKFISVGKSIAQDMRWRFSCVYEAVDCYVQQSDGQIIIKCYKTFKDFKEEKPMKIDFIPRSVFEKVIVNGPATIGFSGRSKYIIKKADDDAYDLEKAFLMLYAKSQFDNDEDFHKWFKVNMKMFKEAYDKDRPDVGELPVVDATAISKNINASLERMSKALHNYKDRLNSVYGKAAVDDNIIVKKRNKWTEEEEDFLRRRYKTSNLFKLSMVLGRSEAAVKTKAHRLGLDKE